MATYPEVLIPQTTETLYLPSGALAKIPKAEPLFRQWQGEFTGDTYGNKPLVDVDGQPMFAELAILKLFQKDGWEGVWVDTFRRKYRTAWGDEGVVRLSGDTLQLVKAINERAGSASGCFDVYCWKDEQVMFAESKRRSKDSIRESQLQWLEAAIRAGVDPDSFLIVEWSFSNPLMGSSKESYPQTSTQEQITSTRNLSVARAEIVENPGTESEDPTPLSPSPGGVEIFFDAYDEDAHGKFLKWREHNHRGYVISRRSPNDAMIHRAYCGHFEHGDKSVSLTRTMKVCSTDRRELEGWSREYIASSLKTCRSCM